MRASFSVDAAACIRCAACSILAPRVFAVSRKGSSVLAQPDAEADARAARAAALACPTQAIREAPR